MPLLIGSLVLLILVGLGAPAALGENPALGPDDASAGVVVAPEEPSGDPLAGETIGDAGSPGVEGASSGVGVWSWVAPGLLAFHVLWACGAGAVLWRRRRDILRPDPALLGPGGDRAMPLGWLLLLGAMLVWLSLSLGSGSARVLIGIDGEELGTLRGQSLLLLGSYVGAALAFAFVLTMAPPVLSALGRRPGLGDLAGAVRAYVLAHPFVWLTGVVGVWVAHALAGADTPIDPLAHDTLRRLADEPRDVWWVLLILTAVVGAPIIEELIYRGLIQNGIARLTRAPLVSVVGTSLVFALVHYGAVSAHALPTLFVLSLAFGVAYMKTGRLGVPILMHAVFNGMNVTLALLSVG